MNLDTNLDTMQLDGVENVGSDELDANATCGLEHAAKVSAQLDQRFIPAVQDGIRDVSKYLDVGICLREMHPDSDFVRSLVARGCNVDETEEPMQRSICISCLSKSETVIGVSHLNRPLLPTLRQLVFYVELCLRLARRPWPSNYMLPTTHVDALGFRAYVRLTEDGYDLSWFKADVRRSMFGTVVIETT